MEKEYALHQLNQKIIKESQGFISQVLDYQIEMNNQIKKLNKDVNTMVILT